MNGKEIPVETLLEKVEDYSKVTAELFNLNVIDKSVELTSSFVAQLVIFVIVALFTLIINIGIALWIGDILGKSYFGFFAIAAAYLIIALLLIYFRNRWIKTLLGNYMITQMLKHKIL